MSRRKIKIKMPVDEKPQKKGVPKRGSHAEKRAQKIGDLNIRRKHSILMREMEEKKAQEAEAEAARIAEDSDG
ncbi:MAG: hypothetical protein GY841_15610 [FCB group bacterium]|nr:hypothetical protein [FCB group bacterium]